MRKNGQKNDKIPDAARACSQL